jgi:DNA-binding transcriptional ArsR family regulator
MHRRQNLTPEAIELVAARFKVMGEPIRLQILQSLDGGEKSIGELAGELGASQPNVSKHVRILQDAGMVSRRQEKNMVYCSIADPRVFELCDVVCSSLRERVAQQARSLPAPRGRARRSIGT